MSYPEKNYIIGIGCRRAVPLEEIRNAIDAALKTAGLKETQISCAASCNIKSNEPGLLDAVKEKGWDIIFYSAQDLDRVNVQTKSDRVKRHTGTGSVSEAAALLRSQAKRLILPKTKYGSVTVAIAI